MESETTTSTTSNNLSNTVEVTVNLAGCSAASESHRASDSETNRERGLAQARARRTERLHQRARKKEKPVYLDVESRTEQDVPPNLHMQPTLSSGNGG